MRPLLFKALPAMALYLPAGIPVDCMKPNFQAIKMHTNSKIENPTRKASARAMLLVFRLPPEPSLSIKKSAEAKLAMMAINANATR